MINATISMDQSMAGQAGQALQIQTYCNSVKQQVSVDFSQFPNLKDNQTQINQGLDVAKGHADLYLNQIQPQIITNISNISNYYALQNAIPTVLPPGSTKAQWLRQLNVIKEQAVERVLESAALPTVAHALSGLADAAVSASSTKAVSGKVLYGVLNSGDGIKYFHGSSTKADSAPTMSPAAIRAWAALRSA